MNFDDWVSTLERNALEQSQVGSIAFNPKGELKKTLDYYQYKFGDFGFYMDLKAELKKRLSELQFEFRITKLRGDIERSKILCSAIMKLEEEINALRRDDSLNG